MGRLSWPPSSCTRPCPPLDPKRHGGASQDRKSNRGPVPVEGRHRGRRGPRGRSGRRDHGFGAREQESRRGSLRVPCTVAFVPRIRSKIGRGGTGSPPSTRSCHRQPPKPHRHAVVLKIRPDAPPEQGVVRERRRRRFGSFGKRCDGVEEEIIHLAAHSHSIVQQALRRRGSLLGLRPRIDNGIAPLPDLQDTRCLLSSRRESSAGASQPNFSLSRSRGDG
jgi:hypothetical protein